MKTLSKNTAAGASSFGSPLDHLEDLIDELIKDNPEENLVRLHMKAIGIRYTSDPVSRMSLVLEALEVARETRPSGRSSSSSPTTNRKINGPTNGPRYGTSRGKDL